MPKTIRLNGAGELSVSLYADLPATDAEVAAQMAKLFVCFPGKEPFFWNVLSERIEANGFTAERLKDAVAHVLDNFRYKELNVADVISFDRLEKLYTGSEYMKAQMNGAQPSDFERREIDGTLYWVKKRNR